MPIAIAPGARVLIRDAEWIVKRTDRASAGGWSLQVVGVSELVRDKEARFVTAIEDQHGGVTVLDPADTTLAPDPSPQFRDTRLYLESLLRQSPPTTPDLYIGHRAAIDDLPYQLDPALQALAQPRQRILMADAVGLGKTIEAGILLAELIRRGRGRRILVVAVKSMLTQLQKELWARFTIPLVRLDSEGLQRIRALIPTNANPFHYYDKAIISIDTLKQDAEYRVYLEHARWDVIVIDEAHNVAERGQQSSLRARLARLLATRSDTLIMASATPHDGRPRSFASLMNMLDATAIADPDHYGPDDIRGLFLRRFKKDIRAQVEGAFLDRTITEHRATASPAEEAAFEWLVAMTFRSFDRVRRSGHHLFRTVLEKALFSSPAACLQTIRERLRKLGREPASGQAPGPAPGPSASTPPEVAHDRAQLEELERRVAAITPADFTKYQKLVAALRPGGELGWNPSDPKDRLVIFTERIETLRFLETHLKENLRLAGDQVATLWGDADDRELQATVEAFGRHQAPVVILGAGLAPRTACYLVVGEVPNLKGQPAIHSWFAVVARPGQVLETVTLDEFLRRTRFHETAVANPGAALDLLPWQSLLPDVVRAARAWMSARRAEWQAAMDPKLEEIRRNLERLKQRQREQLDLQFPDDGTVKGTRLDRRREQERTIERRFRDHEEWVADTMTTEDSPYLRIAALFVAGGRT